MSYAPQQTRVFTCSPPTAPERRYNGPVTLIRPLTHDEADTEIVGPMWRVRTPSGEIFDAFEDELS